MLTESDFTTARVHKETLKVLQKYAKVRGWSFAQFCDNLANLLVLGIDGLETETVEFLRKTYPYTDIGVFQDIRKFEEPEGE